MTARWDGTAVTLSWSPPALTGTGGVTTYLVDRYELGSWIRVATTGEARTATDRSIKVTARCDRGYDIELGPCDHRFGETVQYRIGANYGGRWGQAPAVISVTLAMPAPTTPTGVVVEGRSVRWNTVPGASYRLTYRAVWDFDLTFVQTGSMEPGLRNYYDGWGDASLPSGRIWVRVTAYNSAGTSAPSAEVMVTIPKPPPPPPPPVFYVNCTAVRAAGKAPLYRSQPGYRLGLDGDADGIACENVRQAHRWYHTITTRTTVRVWRNHRWTTTVRVTYRQCWHTTYTYVWR